ncbi:MAG: hypothetical protein OXI63_19100, partial [Candidatus Poribacteria bacterium]|nr:hypothetical protein [Candidatus Poribacteria bacterium]
WLGPGFCLGKEMGISLSGPVVYADAYTDELKKLVKSEGLIAEANPPEGMTTIRLSGFPEINVWEAQMTAFRESVKSGAPSLLPPEGVLLTNVIMDGIFRSHAAGKEVAVRVPEI